MRLPSFLSRFRRQDDYHGEPFFSSDPETRRVTTAVKAGAALLDEHRPGWYNDVNPARLDLHSGFDCILGQIYGDYGDGLHALELDHGAPYGFIVAYRQYEHAQDLWRGEIVRRKVASPQDSR